MELLWVNDIQNLNNVQILQSPYQNVNLYKGTNVATKTFIFVQETTSLLLGSIKQTAFGDVVNWFGGPIIEGEKEKKQDLLYYICDVLHSKNYIGINNVTFNFYRHSNVQEWSEVFYSAGFFVNTIWATYILNLDPDIEFLMSKMQNGLKKNIKKMLGREYIVKEILDSQVRDDYVSIMNEARKRAGLIPLFDLGATLDSVKHNPWRKYFVLYIEGRPMACQGIIFNNKVATEVVLGISDYAIKNKIYAGDLLKWEIFKWCIAKGIEYYDFAGVAPNPQTEKERGIYQYKQKWGGNYIEYPVWSKGLSPRFTLYRTTTMLRNKLSDLRKRIIP